MASSHCLSLSCLALLMTMAAATQYRVGGPAGWTVPTVMSFDQWAERNRFQIGDSLLFVYPPDRDSVLRVTRDAYSTCNTSSYLRRFDDGNTVFTFDKSGPYYFISGSENNCLRNESMGVVVMADRSNRMSNVTPAMDLSPPPPAATLPLPPPSSPAEVPPPSPSEVPPPSPPSSAEVPPPSTLEAPPLSPSEVPPPPPAPTAEESSPPPPPPNAASFKVVGFMSSVGALFGSLFFML